jgi:hypothetical protein
MKNKIKKWWNTEPWYEKVALIGFIVASLLFIPLSIFISTSGPHSTTGLISFSAFIAATLVSVFGMCCRPSCSHGW